jgi:outer membrane biosynthesis protein TonB
VLGNVLDVLNQPVVFFLLLVGSGGFLIAGEVEAIARAVRRTAGENEANGKAAPVRSLGPARRYRLTLLFAAGILLLSAFGTVSASFTQQISGGMKVEVVFPTIIPTPTATPTDTLAPTAAPSATPTRTAAPIKAPTPTAAPTKAPTPTAAPTTAPTPTAAPTTAPTPTAAPTTAPTPTAAPTTAPTPTAAPTDTLAPTAAPTDTPTPAEPDPSEAV